MNGPQPEAGQPYAEDRSVMEVAGFGGRASEIEFKVRRDGDEIWHQEHSCVVFDRDLMRQWLTCFGGSLVVDEVRFGGGPGAAMAVSLPGIPAWTLSRVVLAQLRQQV